MSTEPDPLAAQFLRADHQPTLQALAAAGPELTRQVAARVGEELRRDALVHWNVCPRERTWVDHQRALLALAGLPGVDQAALAVALTEACCLQRVDGTISPLDPNVFAWMMRHAEDRVYQAAEDERSTGHRFLAAGLWAYTDARAREWMLHRFRVDPIGARFAYDDMRVGYLRSTWNAPEWNRRVHMLCDADLPDAPFRIDPDLPIETSAAQTRLACTYARSSTDLLLRQAARNLRAYRTADPAADTRLVHWDVDDLDLELLGGLLEAAGAAGERPALVWAAHEAGLIDADRAVFLAAARPHPDWMDGEVPWEVDESLVAGWVSLPDGRLGAADPYWSFQGIPFVLDVPPGKYPVTVTTALHPLYGRACAIAELTLGQAATAVRWEPAPRADNGEFGYRVEVGVGSFGAASALSDAPIHDLGPPDFPGSPGPACEQVDCQELGSVVMFHVAPQHQLCRTWIGRSTDGTAVGVLSDLGILHIDPAAHPDDPRRPGPPPTAPHREPYVAEHEHTAGVRSGSRWRDRADGSAVTVLQVLLPEHSWLRDLSVSYRSDDTRAGQVLTAEQFRARFTAA